MTALNYRTDHIMKNKYSRPGHKLLRVQAIVVHYTANPSATAANHYKYFNTPTGGGGRYAGAHIFIDKDEALELIPLDEVAYHANEKSPKLSALKASVPFYPGGNANLLTIGIEMCIEKDGTFHSETVERTRMVIKKLQDQFPDLKDTKNRVVRHYDITGKICPKPFVDDEQKWKAFLSSIDQPVKVASKPASKPSTPSKAPDKSNDRYLNLHKHMSTWNHYSTKVQPIKKNADKTPLRPAKFGGLSYKIEGNPYPDVYTIRTGQFGLRNIYAPRDRDSSITSKPLYK